MRRSAGHPQLGRRRSAVVSRKYLCLFKYTIAGPYITGGDAEGFVRSGKVETMEPGAAGATALKTGTERRGSGGRGGATLLNRAASKQMLFVRKTSLVQNESNSGTKLVLLH